MAEDSKDDDISGLCSVYREIAELMGMDVASQFYNHFKGQQVTFPNKLYDSGYLKNEILEEYAQGKSIRELSVKFGYTERRIRQIVQVEKK
ncbi:MAG: Mor transcription activator family protein [Lachnospiraceae bacterium]|nr:Mor transcription activator family protein [Lachnospiraceae bacterium]